MTIVTGEQSKAIASAAIEQVATTLAAIAYLELIAEEVLTDLEPIVEPMLNDLKVRVANTLDALQIILPEGERKPDVVEYIEDFIEKTKADHGGAVQSINLGLAMKRAAKSAAA